MARKILSKVIILGHTGFIGQHLTAYCRQKTSNHEVIGYSYPEVDLTIADSLEIYSSAFTQDATVIILSAIKPNRQNDLISFSKNVAMIVNLCTFIKNYPVKNILYMSSAAVYGEDIHHERISEDTPVQPRSFYGIAKYTCERLLWKTCDELKDTALLIIRPPVVYGPGESEISYNPAGFLKMALNKEPIVIWGDGSEKREFIYIDDITRIIYLLASGSFKGVINIASGTSYSFTTILTCISTLIGQKVATKSQRRSKEKVDHQFDNSKLSALVPNFQYTPLTKGLQLVAKSL